MFENIIAQQETVAQLREEIGKGTLPSALLIHGRQYSGKLSVALEIARVLTCGERGEWSCGCNSCKEHKLLASPGTVMLGPRYFTGEIAACGDVMRRTRNQPSRFLFVRSVRKLTRRFDAMLWESQQQRLRAVYGKIEEAEEALGEIEPGAGPLPDCDALKKTVDRVQAVCAEIAASVPRDNTPVDVIRRAAYWTHLSGPGDRKLVILENADRMADASRNSLLKLLEEPPSGVSVILLCTNRNALIPTVRSRVRPYLLRPRDQSSSGEVLRRIFRTEDEKYSSLDEYFHSWESVARGEIRSMAKQFLEAAADPESPETDVLQSYSKAERPGYFAAFCEELVEALREVRRSQGVSLRVLEEWNAIVRKGWSRYQTYHASPPLLVQDMLYRMRAGL